MVVLCYFFVDRPVAMFVHEHRFYPDKFLLWPPLAFKMALLRDRRGHDRRGGVVVMAAGRPLQRLLLAIAANLAATEGIKDVLKWRSDARGRRNRLNNNAPAWIPDGVYGFHPFHVGGAYQSFPSGHAAATFAVVSILWLCLPRWRWLQAAAAGLVCSALVGLNFHFVGDVIAGAMLGSVTGVIATRLFGLRPPSHSSPR